MADKKKIKRRKPGTVLDKRKVNPGRPNLIDLDELTKEMKDLAFLKSRGVSDKVIMQKLNISKYKIKTYIDLPKVQEAIEQMAEEMAEEDLERFVKKYDSIVDASLDVLLSEIRNGKVSHTMMKGIIDSKMISIKGSEGTGDSGIETEEFSITAKRKRPALEAMKNITVEERKALLPQEKEDDKEVTDLTGMNDGEQDEDD